MPRTTAICEAEASDWLLAHGGGKERCKKAQEFAVRDADTETDRATYQAMEALVHNLNTMHSRAGAQIPFSLH